MSELTHLKSFSKNKIRYLQNKEQNLEFITFDDNNDCKIYSKYLLPFLQNSGVRITNLELSSKKTNINSLDACKGVYDKHTIQIRSMVELSYATDLGLYNLKYSSTVNSRWSEADTYAIKLNKNVRKN